MPVRLALLENVKLNRVIELFLYGGKIVHCNMGDICFVSLLNIVMVSGLALVQRGRTLFAFCGGQMLTVPTCSMDRVKAQFIADSTGTLASIVPIHDAGARLFP
jgi:hypothetical protein